MKWERGNQNEERGRSLAGPRYCLVDAALGVLCMRVSHYEVRSRYGQLPAPRSLNQTEPMTYWDAPTREPAVNGDQFQRGIARRCVRMNGLSIGPLGQQFYDRVINHIRQHNDHFGHMSSVPKW